MSDTLAIRGSLFTPDFLTDSIREIDDWNTLAEGALDRFKEAVEEIFAPFPISQKPNETQTEDDLIWPLLGALGWTAWLRQQNLSPKGRDDVPDGILFESDGDQEQGQRLSGGMEALRAQLRGGRIQTMGAAARPSLGATRRGNRAFVPNAALPAPRRRCDRRRAEESCAHAWRRKYMIHRGLPALPRSPRNSPE